MTGAMWLSINGTMLSERNHSKGYPLCTWYDALEKPNDKGRKQTTLLAGPAGRVGPQNNRGGFQDNKIVLCPIFGRHYTTVYICYNQWSGF